MTSRVAIVTAAGRGIGAACARELARQGYSLALMSPSGAASKLADEWGGVGVDGSVTILADLERLVGNTVSAFGRIDAVVNGAGHPAKGDLLAITDEDWRAGYDHLFMSVVRMARLVTPHMERQGGGAFVNLSTFAAGEPSLKFPVSAAVRASLGSFAKLYSQRYASVGIRMNNVLPGFVDSFPVDESNLADIPMRRYATTHEIARTVAFLLSSDAGYITGQSLRVDGGLTRSI